MKHTIFFSLFLLFTIANAFADVVQVEIIQPAGGYIELSQTWGRELASTDAPSIQFRNARPGDAISITESGTDAYPVWKIIGTMDSHGTILMPDGTRFRYADASGLATWIRELPGKMRAKKQAENAPSQGDFGLSAQMTQQLFNDMKQTIADETAGLSPVEIISKCAKGLSAPIRASSAQKKALDDLDPIDEELSSLSKGTILAYALRPAGLVLIPRELNGRLVYCVETGQKNVKPWPIGTKVERRETDVIPDMLKIIPVSFNDVSLRDALESVSGRLDVPFLYDLNSMARFGIDLDTTKVTIPAGKMSYLVLMKKIMAKCQLKYELRMDENGEPFFWITTFRAATAK